MRLQKLFNTKPLPNRTTENHRVVYLSGIRDAWLSTRYTLSELTLFYLLKELEGVEEVSLH